MTRPTVAFAFHWEWQQFPEGRTAFPHYRAAIEALAADPDRPYDLLGHAHPRAWPQAQEFYARAGIAATPDAAVIFATADVLVADTTSLIYEFASLDRPVVVLNAPWYRREVEHGLRFWSCADVGIQVDEPEDLAGAIARSLTDPDPIAQRRRQVVAEVYSGGCDGRASERAVDAIHAVIGTAIARQARSNGGDPYAPKSSVTISGFSPRLDVHPPIPRLVWLGAPPELVSHVRQEWEGLSAEERLTAVDMFEHLTDDEVRAQIAEGLAELAADETQPASGVASHASLGTAQDLGERERPGRALSDTDGRYMDAPPTWAVAAVVLEWVGNDPGRAGWWLAVENSAEGQHRSTLIRKLMKVATRG